MHFKGLQLLWIDKEFIVCRSWTQEYEWLHVWFYFSLQSSPVRHSSVFSYLAFLAQSWFFVIRFWDVRKWRVETYVARFSRIYFERFAICFVFVAKMPSISGKMDSEEEDMDQDTPESDKSDSRSSHSGSGSDEEESSGMKWNCMPNPRAVYHITSHGENGSSSEGPLYPRNNDWMRSIEWWYFQWPSYPKPPHFRHFILPFVFS